MQGLVRDFAFYKPEIEDGFLKLEPDGRVFGVHSFFTPRAAYSTKYAMQHTGVKICIGSFAVLSVSTKHSRPSLEGSIPSIAPVS